MTPVEVFENAGPNLAKHAATVPGRWSKCLLMKYADGWPSATIGVLSNVALADLCSRTPALADVPRQVAELRLRERCIIPCLVIVPPLFAVCVVEARTALLRLV